MRVSPGNNAARARRACGALALAAAACLFGCAATTPPKPLDASSDGSSSSGSDGAGSGRTGGGGSASDKDALTPEQDAALAKMSPSERAAVVEARGQLLELRDKLQTKVDERTAENQKKLLENFAKILPVDGPIPPVEPGWEARSTERGGKNAIDRVIVVKADGTIEEDDASGGKPHKIRRGKLSPEVVAHIAAYAARAGLTPGKTTQIAPKSTKPTRGRKRRAKAGPTPAPAPFPTRALSPDVASQVVEISSSKGKRTFKMEGVIDETTKYANVLNAALRSAVFSTMMREVK